MIMMMMMMMMTVMKVRLEDEVLEKIRLQLTADKATEYSAKIVRHLRERTKDLEIQVR